MPDQISPEDLPQEWVDDAQASYSMHGLIRNMLAGAYPAIRRHVLRDVAEGRVTLEEHAAAQGVEPLGDVSKLAAGAKFTKEELAAWREALRRARYGRVEAREKTPKRPDSRKEIQARIDVSSERISGQPRTRRPVSRRGAVRAYMRGVLAAMQGRLTRENDALRADNAELLALLRDRKELMADIRSLSADILNAVNSKSQEERPLGQPGEPDEEVEQQAGSRAKRAGQPEQRGDGQ